MSQLIDITIYDGAATPVAHVMKGISVTRERGKVIALWREALAGVPVDAQVSMTHTIEKMPKSGMYKVEQRVVFPIQEVVTGANASGYSASPKVAYENQLVTTGWFHGRSSVAERRTIRQFSTNVVNVVGTSVAAATTGFAADLYDQLIPAS